MDPLDAAHLCYSDEKDKPSAAKSRLSDSSSSTLSSQRMGNTDPEKDLEKATTTPDSPIEGDEAAKPVIRVKTAQDWDGPEDPENPQNWPLWTKIYHTFIVGLMAFTVTFASSVYTPGIFDVSHRFHVSQVAALVPLTVYVLGLGFGPVISAPLSETFGRRAVYLITFPTFMLFILGSGLAQNYGTLVVCRFLAGMFGSSVLAVGAGTNTDLWAPLNRAVASAIFLMAPFAGPALGPAVGGFAAEAKGFRWTQWPILFLGAFTQLIALPLPGMQRETYKKIILQWRAKKLGIAPPPNPLPPGAARIKFLLTVTVARPLHMLLLEPIVSFFSIYTAFNFSVLFGFFDAFPIVFQGVYRFRLGPSGLCFLGIGLGVVLATIAFILIDRVTYRKWTLERRKNGNMQQLPPEHRLYPAMLGSLLLPLGLFWFAWSARSSVHWIVPILASVPFGAGNTIIFCSAVLYLIDTYGALNGASAMAANGLLRYALGAVFPLFTVQMYRAMGIGWATSLFGFVTVGLCPIPWVLWKWGPKIRGRSSYDTFKGL